MSEDITKYETQSIEKVWSNPQEVKRMIAPGLNDTEFAMFMAISKSTGMNPLLREIWAVKYRGDIPAQVFIGRDGYRRRAQELPSYEGHTKAAIFENDQFEVINGIPHHKFSFSKRGRLMGAYCVVYIKGRKVPFVEVVEISEYSKPGKNGKPTLWDTHPATMIQKVAEAQGLRGAFQGIFRGTYDETEQWEESATSGIIPPDNYEEQKHAPQPPEQTPVEKAHAAILTLCGDLHPNAFANSIKKHLFVNRLQACKDIEELSYYYTYKKSQMYPSLDLKTKEIDTALGLIGKAYGDDSSKLDEFMTMVNTQDWVSARSMIVHAYTGKGAKEKE